MTNYDIAMTQLPNDLTHSLYIWLRLYVTHSTTNLSDHYIKFTCLAKKHHPAFDLISDMRDHLHGFAEICSFTFFVDDILINTAGSHVIGLRCRYIEETLIMPEVEIGLCAVFGHIAFAMFVWIEGARIYIDIRVKFLNSTSDTLPNAEVTPPVTNIYLAIKSVFYKKM